MSLCLAELQGAPWAQGLMVEGVDPAPDASRLSVTVLLCDGGVDEAQEALARLQQHAGRLRWEVAQAITRKKAPELIFTLAAPDWEVDGG